MRFNGSATPNDLGNAAPNHPALRPERRDGGEAFAHTHRRYRFGALEFVTNGNGKLVLEDPQTGRRFAPTS